MDVIIVAGDVVVVVLVLVVRPWPGVPIYYRLLLLCSFSFFRLLSSSFLSSSLLSLVRGRIVPSNS